jgi:hypothetical protein
MLLLPFRYPSREKRPAIVMVHGEIQDRSYARAWQRLLARRRKGNLVILDGRGRNHYDPGCSAARPGGAFT